MNVDELVDLSAELISVSCLLCDLVKFQETESVCVVPRDFIGHGVDGFGDGKIVLGGVTSSREKTRSFQLVHPSRTETDFIFEA